MRKESRILTYIPKEFHSRFEAIRDIANSIRLEEKCKTRIKMGFMDLQLHKKEKLIGKWELVHLPAGLPPVELGLSPKKADSGSPAPGRPCQAQLSSSQLQLSSALLILVMLTLNLQFKWKTRQPRTRQEKLLKRKVTAQQAQLLPNLVLVSHTALQCSQIPRQLHSKLIQWSFNSSESTSVLSLTQ